VNPSDEIRAEVKKAKQATKPINDGGSISPRLVSTESGVEPQGGMSLRDWFAGMALQGITTNAQYQVENTNPYWTSIESYAIADAMLAARTKGGQNE